MINRILIFLFLFFEALIYAQPLQPQLKLQDVVKFKNRQVISLHSKEFKFRKLKPIPFIPFSFEDFRVNSNDNIKLKNGKTVPAEKFLKDVNEIERKLNEWGYSLKDDQNEIIIGELNYPYEIIEKQTKILELSSDKIMPQELRITPCGILTDDEIQSALKSGTPQEPLPIKNNKEWSESFGDDNLGLEILSNTELNAEEKNSALYVSTLSKFEVKVRIFKETIPALYFQDRIFNKPFQNQMDLFLFNEKVIDDYFKSSVQKKYYKNLEWETGIEFSLGPFDVSGTFSITGNVGMDKTFTPDNLKLQEKLIPNIYLVLSGSLNVDFEIVEAGIDGKIKFVDDTLSIFREIELVGNDKNSYYIYKANAYNKLIESLKGRIYAYLNIDYLIGTKKFLLVFYNNEKGFNVRNNLFSANITQPSRRDRELYLEITRINGITNYTARNEKNNVSPLSFEIFVDAGGQNFVEKIADWNKDGIIESPVKLKIPMMSSLSIPITISIKQNYKIGTMVFNSWLDLSKGEAKGLEFCYNPVSRKINGAVEGIEEQEIISTGDINYFGERNHTIKFKLTPHMPFKLAPTKAK